MVPLYPFDLNQGVKHVVLRESVCIALYIAHAQITCAYILGGLE